jgi:hypothetical protein
MVFFAILMLVFVADPLAVTLTIACNMALIRFWDVKRPHFSARTAPAVPGFIESMVEGARTMASLAYRETFEQEKPGAHRRHSIAKKTASRKSRLNARRR